MRRAGRPGGLARQRRRRGTRDLQPAEPEAPGDPQELARVGRGLDSYERTKNAPGTFKLAALAAAPSTIAEISNITVKAAKARDRLHELRAASVTAVENHRDQITTEYRDLGMVENENGIGRLDTLGADRRPGWPE